jgi:hypothetical protein
MMTRSDYDNWDLASRAFDGDSDVHDTATAFNAKRMVEAMAVRTRFYTMCSPRCRWRASGIDARRMLYVTVEFALDAQMAAQGYCGAGVDRGSQLRRGRVGTDCLARL